ncbi:hypothetical protein D5086_019014 [Populus alba]|uniref:Uncharacterized protein n=1 Tax=Populus alba TaxID=43335 RepID=A0ACC4BGN7_POPAL
MSGGGISGSKDPFSSLVDLNESETRWCCASNKWFQGIKYEFQVQYWMTLERSTIAFLLRSSRHRFNLQLVIRFDMFFHTFLGKCYQQYLEDLGGQPLSEVKMIGIGFWLGGGSVNDSHGVATTELEGLQLPPAGVTLLYESMEKYRARSRRSAGYLSPLLNLSGNDGILLEYIFQLIPNCCFSVYDIESMLDAMTRAANWMVVCLPILQVLHLLVPAAPAPSRHCNLVTAVTDSVAGKSDQPWVIQDPENGSSSTCLSEKDAGGLDDCSKVKSCCTFLISHFLDTSNLPKSLTVWHLSTKNLSEKFPFDVLTKTLITGKNGSRLPFSPRNIIGDVDGCSNGLLALFSIKSGVASWNSINLESSKCCLILMG